MRAILAGLFVFGGLLGTVAVLGHFGLFEALPAPLLGLFIGVCVAIPLCVVALWLFNQPGARRQGGKALEEQIRELEEQSLLVAADFQATRALGVEEYEDEGSHYFLELADGSVLFLTGQYLYDYDDEDAPEGRRFPCTQFSVRRHKTEGYAVDIKCSGAALEVEATAPPFGESVWQEGDVPDDGSIITDRSFDAVKAENMGRAG